MAQNKVSKMSREGQQYFYQSHLVCCNNHQASKACPSTYRNGSWKGTVKERLVDDHNMFSFPKYLQPNPGVPPSIDPNGSSSDSASEDDEP